MGKRSTKVKVDVFRAVGVVAVLLVIVSGVTFAALQSQQDTLTGNTIQTATANLQLSTDGVNFTNSQAGFNFNNLVPGGPAVPTAGYGFYLKNAGGTALSLKMAIVNTPTNPDSVDLSKVSILLTTVGSGTGIQTFSLQSLLAPGGVALTGNSLTNGTTQQYKLQVSMTTDAISGSSASLGNLDFAFSGTAVSN
jgi:hypothetical protein